MRPDKASRRSPTRSTARARRHRARGRGRRPSWAISNVRSILRQPLYRGIARWNRVKQHDEDGNSILEVNPESEHVTFYNPEWRIVSDALADAVDACFADEGRKKFASKPGARAKYLLSGGMLLCPTCGGRFEALNGKYYVCATRRHAGTSVCANPLALRIEVFDDVVLRLLEGQVLHPVFVEQVLNLACGNRTDDGRAPLEAQRDEQTAQINRLLAVAAAGAGDVPELAATIKKKTLERDALDRRLAVLAEPIDRAALKAALEQRCEDWQKRLRSEYADEARFVVQQLIGPLTLWFGRAEDLFGTEEEREALAAAGFDANDRRGKEGLTFEDYGFKAVVTPQGLLNGLGAFNMVAGACNQRYLQLWQVAA
jgi:hypothetical protein